MNRTKSPIVLWTQEEDDVIKKHLKEKGDNKEAEHEAYLELAGKRTQLAVKTRIYTLGMRGDLNGVCNVARFIKLREAKRQRILKKEKQEFEQKNKDLKDQVLNQPETEAPVKDKAKKKKKKRFTGMNLDNHLVIAGSTVIEGKPFVGMLRITGKFVVEIIK